MLWLIIIFSDANNVSFFPAEATLIFVNASSTVIVPASETELLSVPIMTFEFAKADVIEEAERVVLVVPGSN